MSKHPVIERLISLRCEFVPIDGKTIAASCGNHRSVWMRFSDGTWYASDKLLSVYEMVDLDNSHGDTEEHPLVTLGLVTVDELKECDEWLRQHQVELQKEERRKTFERLKQEFGDVDGPRVVEMLLGAISELVVGPVTDYLDTNEQATLFAYLEKHKPDSVYLS
jgi:hypothetical protein